MSEHDGREASTGVSNTEVVTARRRQFTGEYKRRILDETDRARAGEIGLILRREGLYSSQLASWRKWRSGMTTRKKNGGKDAINLAAYRQLEKENAKLKLKLRKAEAMLELQKKALVLLEEDESSDGSDS